jgi:hypothetical protein
MNVTEAHLEQVQDESILGDQVTKGLSSSGWPGTDVMIFKIFFAEKFSENIGVFDAKQS